MFGLCILHISVLNDIYYTNVFMHIQYVYIVTSSGQNIGRVEMPLNTYGTGKTQE